MNIIKIGVIAVAGVLLAVQFKSGKSEYGIYISIVIGLLIFFSILDYLGEILRAFRSIGEYIKVDSTYITVLLKMLGITYVAEFAASICKDAGYQSIAAQIEIFGKLAIMALSIPVLMTLLNIIRAFLS